MSPLDRPVHWQRHPQREAIKAYIATEWRKGTIVRDLVADVRDRWPVSISEWAVARLGRLQTGIWRPGGRPPSAGKRAARQRQARGVRVPEPTVLAFRRPPALDPTQPFRRELLGA